MNSILSGLHDEGRRLLRDEGFDDTHQRLMTQVDMKYVGQTSEMTVNMLHDTFGGPALEELGEAFRREHEKTYGYRVDEPLQLVNIRVIARGLSQKARVPERIEPVSQTAPTATGPREVYFGPKDGWVDTPVVDRSSLSDGLSEGPLIVEEYDSTTVVPPGWRALLDSLSNIVLERT